MKRQDFSLMYEYKVLNNDKNKYGQIRLFTALSDTLEADKTKIRRNEEGYK